MREAYEQYRSAEACNEQKDSPQTRDNKVRVRGTSIHRQQQTIYIYCCSLPNVTGVLGWVQERFPFQKSHYLLRIQPHVFTAWELPATVKNPADIYACFTSLCQLWGCCNNWDLLLLCDWKAPGAAPSSPCIVHQRPPETHVVLEQLHVPSVSFRFVILTSLWANFSTVVKVLINISCCFPKDYSPVPLSIFFRIIDSCVVNCVVN